MSREDRFWSFILTGDRTRSISQFVDLDCTKESIELYCIKNADGSIKWVFPTSLKEPLFLKFYSVTSLRAKFIKVLLKILFYSKLIGLISTKMRVNVSSKDPFYYSLLGDSFSDQYSIFGGTVGLNRKLIICQKQMSGAVFFTKIPFGEFSHKLVYQESRQLGLLSNMLLNTFCVPIKAESDNAVLKTKEIEYSSARETRFKREYAKTVDEFYSWGTKVKSLDPGQCFFLDKVKHDSLKVLNNQLIRTASLLPFSGLDVKYAFGHGDFTPWNLGFNKDKRLVVIDWELAGDYPMLYDVFHFIIQNHIMNVNSEASLIMEVLEKRMKSVFITDLLVKYGLNWKWQFIAYLVSVSNYYLHVYNNQEVLHKQGVRAVNVWSELLEIMEINLVQNSHRSVVISNLFNFMKDKEYALMKNEGKSLNDISESSDLDIFINKSGVKEVVKWLENQTLLEHIQVKDTSYMTVIEMYFQDGTFLSIDLINQLKRRHVEYLDVKEILHKTVLSKEGVKLPRIEYDFLYITLFYTLNHAMIPRSYVIYFDCQTIIMQVKIKNFLNKKLNVKISLFDDFANQTSMGIANQIVSKKVSAYRGNMGFNSFRNKIMYVLDTIKLCFRNDGVVMTFSGVDGAGKSTIIEKTKQLLETKFRKKVVVIRHRPSVLPILSAWVHGKQKAEVLSMSKLPRQGGNKSVISSLFRFTYYLLDFVIGQFVVWYRYTAKGYVVLYDRYYFDFIEDAKRTNIQLPKWFCKLFYPMVFKHDVNVFLYAQPKTILKRKQELEEKDIIELTASYKQSFSSYANEYNSEYIMIKNESIKETMCIVESLFVQVA